MSDYSEALIEKVKIELDKAEVAGIQITHMLLGEDEAAEHWVCLCFYLYSIECRLFFLAFIKC